MQPLFMELKNFKKLKNDNFFQILGLHTSTLKMLIAVSPFEFVTFVKRLDLNNLAFLDFRIA